MLIKHILLKNGGKNMPAERIRRYGFAFERKNILIG
jgi:hypothetical protein